MFHPPWRSTLSLACIALSAVAIAAGQSADRLAELQRLHDRIVVPGKTVSPQDAKQAAELFEGWKLDLDKLAPADRVRALSTGIVLSLATGDAATALTRHDRMLADAPAEAETLEVGVLVGFAAGDAQRADKALEQLRKSADEKRRKQISLQRRWLNAMGKPAPEGLIRTDDLSEYSLSRRDGRALLIDFWNTTQPAPAESMDALKAVYAEFQYSTNIEFVGVNADAREQKPAAKAFAEKNGLVWKHCFEEQSADAPLTHKAFRAGPPPWQVLVDAQGLVRAVGDCAEPGLAYAVRCAVAEAEGAHELVLPKNIAGKSPEPAKAKVVVEAGGGEKSKEKPATSGRLPSNPEAKQKLLMARTFLRSGNKSKAKELLHEVVDNWPGTEEAREAAEILETLP